MDRKNGYVTIVFDYNDCNFYSQPIEINLKTDKEIKDAGYKIWGQCQYNCCNRITFEGEYDGKTLTLRNKTVVPEFPRIFRKVSKEFVLSNYKRNLIEQELYEPDLYDENVNEE